MKRFILAGVLCVCVITIMYIFFRNPTVSTRPSFIIGTAAGYAPFVSINAQGNYEGFDIEVATELAKRLGKELVIRDLGSMPALFMALEQGSIDAIIWGLSITAERRNRVAMVHYAGEKTTAYPLIFWQQIPQGMTSLNDLAGKVVCVEPTSSQDAVLSKYSAIIKYPVERIDDALLAIQQGKAVAALVEPAIANKFKQRFAEIVTLDVPLSPEDQVDGIGVAIWPTNNVLIDNITRAIRTMREDGTLTQLEKQWSIS